MTNNAPLPTLFSLKLSACSSVCYVYSSSLHGSWWPPKGSLRQERVYRGRTRTSKLSYLSLQRKPLEGTLLAHLSASTVPPSWKLKSSDTSSSNDSAHLLFKHFRPAHFDHVPQGSYFFHASGTEDMLHPPVSKRVVLKLTSLPSRILFCVEGSSPAFPFHVHIRTYKAHISFLEDMTRLCSFDCGDHRTEDQLLTRCVCIHLHVPTCAQHLCDIDIAIK